MKYVYALCVLLSVAMNAQNQRFMYDYKFTRTVKDIGHLKSEMMTLDVTEKGSKFYSWDKKVSDSISDEIIRRQPGSLNINLTGSPMKGRFYQVIKHYPSLKVEFINCFDEFTYQVEDERKINWEISSETKKIGTWNCQKATGDFAGRTWNVWFTMEIPIPDGPYKFRGLPGLIVDAASEGGNHHFRLVGVKNLEEGSVPLRFSSLDSPIKINLKKYKKQVNKYLKDPYANIKREIMKGNTRISVGGRPLSKAEMIKRYDDRLKNQAKRTPIELDLFK